jgi:hypothetical protein
MAGFERLSQNRGQEMMLDHPEMRPTKFDMKRNAPLLCLSLPLFLWLFLL